MPVTYVQSHLLGLTKLQNTSSSISIHANAIGKA
jgi:hypothetical protein